MAMLSLTNQPCGVRFSPTDEELVQLYLRPKISGNDEEVGFIREVNFFKREPRELPDFSGIETITKDQEWFFFSQHDLKHRNGNRLNRKTDAGYWKVTGTDLEIWSVGGESLIGKKKILVFYEGLSPNSKITDWVLHEYHATPTELQGTNPAQKTFVLCRLFKRVKRPNNINGSKGRKRKYSTKAGPAKSKPAARASVSPPSVNYNEGVDNRVTRCCPDGATTSSVSPAPASSVNEEGDHNHVTTCYPTKTFDGTTSNTKAFSTECNHISEKPSTKKDQVADGTADDDHESVDSTMSGVPPELLDIDWSNLFYSPMHPFCMPFPVADNSNYRDDEVPYQYGTNDAAAFTTELWGPMPNYPDAFLHNESMIPAVKRIFLERNRTI